MVKIYEIRDPIYGFIRFNELEKEIIDQPFFQRLRRIKQLGFTDYIYPSGSHTRFEHSLGVMQYATLMYDRILEEDSNKRILKEILGYNDSGLDIARQVLRLAALLHDVGHPPFSHACEELLPKKPGTESRYTHEEYSKLIINKKVKDILKKEHHRRNHKIDVDDITGLIDGIGIYSFWKELISGDIDADRGDYLLRDSHHLGVKYGIYDYQRFIDTLRIAIDEESGSPCIGIDKDGWRTGESLLIARYRLSTQVNSHKTRRVLDKHLRMALSRILPGGSFPSPDKIDDFLFFDDAEIWSLIKKQTSCEHCDALLRRKHYRLHYETKEENEKRKIELEKENFSTIVAELEKKGVDIFTDSIKYNWYADGFKVVDSSIPTYNIVMGDLSEYSAIIGNLKPLMLNRVYKKPE